MMYIGWILIGAYILLIVLLLVKDEYHDKKEKKKRMELRAEIPWPVMMQTDERVVEGKTVNISAGGALICCREPFSLNQIVTLSIKPPIREPLEITAEVVRTNIDCEDDGRTLRGIAVRFIIISEKDRQFVSFSVSDHLRGKDLSTYAKDQLRRL